MNTPDLEKKAIILGAGGQDGKLLSQQLLEKGYSVMGIGRNEADHPRSPSFEFKILDIRNAELLAEELQAYGPNFIFHMAAIHGSDGIQYEEIWHDAISVNTASVHVSLEYMRTANSKCRLVYASSSKVFGEKTPEVINEDTEKRQDCLYSITKNAAGALISHYRTKHHLAASVAYLFNHESRHRKENFFIPIVLKALSSALAGSKQKFSIRSLGFYCDWGCAGEYAGLMIGAAERAPGEDFVIATGESTYARDFVAALFERYGLDYRHYINEVDHTEQNTPYHVDISKLKKKLGTQPSRNIIDVCVAMVESDTSA